MHVRPLTHCGADGNVLTRLPEVEAQIASSLRLEPGELRRRASITDRENADYLKDETLVYLLRESYWADDSRTQDIAAEALFRRCTPYARKHFGSFGERDFEDAHAELLEKVIKLIVDLDDDQGDFLQVRFGRQLRFLALSIFRRHVPQINEVRDQALLSSLEGYDSADEGAESHNLVPAELQVHDDEHERQRQSDEALEQIPEPQRTAFVLRYRDKWPIQSKKQGTPSLSGFFDVDPITIHNWLTAAERALETWRGQES
jgi:DNA-directed RNA polymerase specialized sigma24 family protein